MKAFIFILVLSVPLMVDSAEKSGDIQLKRSNLNIQPAQFFLSNHHHKYVMGNANILKAINATNPVIFLVHGYIDMRATPWYFALTDALLNKSDCNVIQVDWSVLAHADYVTAAKNVGIIGKAVGEFLLKIHENRSVPLQKFRIIGHSLGAHIGGISGKLAISSKGTKIGRITGIEVAGPLFEVPPAPSNMKLTDTDASMVECVHTDGGEFGFKSSVGKVDFFINGGVPPQPGCEVLVGCSHLKSRDYYIEAIRSGGVKATKCHSYEEYLSGHCKSNPTAMMGNDLPKDISGNYYLEM